MERTYQIDPIEGGGWRLKLYEDGEEAGGGRCDEDDSDGYDSLVEAGEQFAGIDQTGFRP